MLFQHSRNTRGQYLPREKRKILPSFAPSKVSDTPLTWRVRQYVNNDGASYEPVLADIVTGSLEYHIQSFRGFIDDANHDQYAHKAYSARLIAKQDVTIPIQIYWPGQLAIITDIGGVETTEHTTGTDANVSDLFTVDLTRGVNDLHILTYTGVANARLQIILDMASIHNSVVLIGATKTSDAIPFSFTIDKPDLIELTTTTLFPVEDIFWPQGITMVKFGIKTPEAASTYSVDLEEWDSPTDGAPTAMATVATSGSTEASTTSFTSATLAAGSILRVAKPAADISELNVWGGFTKNS